MTTVTSAPTITTSTEGRDVKKPDDIDTPMPPGDGFTSRTIETYTPTTTPPGDDHGEATSALNQKDGNAVFVAQNLFFFFLAQNQRYLVIHYLRITLQSCVEGDYHTQYFILEVNTIYVGLGITAAIVVVLILVGIAVFVGYKSNCLTFNKQDI